MNGIRLAISFLGDGDWPHRYLTGDLAVALRQADQGGGLGCLPGFIVHACGATGWDDLARDLLAEVRLGVKEVAAPSEVRSCVFDQAGLYRKRPCFEFLSVITRSVPVTREGEIVGSVDWVARVDADAVAGYHEAAFPGGEIEISAWGVEWRLRQDGWEIGYLVR